MRIHALALVLAVSACGNNTKGPSDAPVATSIDARVPRDAPAADAGIDAPVGGCARNSDCQADEICQWAPQHACGVDGGRGVCTHVEAGLCPDLAFWVCACNGHNYLNQCLSDTSMSDIGYGGPCRATGVFVPCSTSDDCPTDLTFHQFCVDDPRDQCDPALGDTGCAGVCVHAQQTCSDVLPCTSTGSTSTVNSPDTEACIPLVGQAADADPGACVYTTRLRCVSSTDCGSGELCVPDFACVPGSTCLKWCVRP